MKKLIFLVAIMAMCFGGVYAQTPQTKSPPAMQDTKAKTAKADKQQAKMAKKVAKKAAKKSAKKAAKKAKKEAAKKPPVKP